jgi:hypothetical protein
MRGCDQLHEAGKSENIDLELAAGFVKGDVFHSSVGAVAGIIKEDIDAALFGTDSLGRPYDGTVNR